MANIKVPCGGFYLGEGLSVADDGVTVNVTGGGGGDSMFIVNGTLTDSSSQLLKGVADKGFNEILEAYNAGKNIVMHVEYEGIYLVFNINAINNSSDSQVILYSCIGEDLYICTQTNDNQLEIRVVTLNK